MKLLTLTPSYEEPIHEVAACRTALAAWRGAGGTRLGQEIQAARVATWTRKLAIAEVTLAAWRAAEAAEEAQSAPVDNESD